MSIELMKTVWTCQFSKTDQLVMLALADFADDDGHKIYPSMAFVAWKTGLSKRQVQRTIAKMKTNGHLQVVKPSTPTSPATYQMVLDHADKKPPFRPARQTKQTGGDTQSPHDTQSPDDSLSPHDTQSQGGDSQSPPLVTHSHPPSDTVSPDPSLDPSYRSISDPPSSSSQPKNGKRHDADAVDAIIQYSFNYAGIDPEGWSAILDDHECITPAKIIAAADEFSVEKMTRNIGTGILVNRLKNASRHYDDQHISDAEEYLIYNLPEPLQKQYADSINWILENE